MFYEKGSPTRIGFLLMNSLKPFLFLCRLMVIMQCQSGLSLRGGGWGFLPATMNVAPGYFKGK